jgi:hypothetical protein
MFTGLRCRITDLSLDYLRMLFQLQKLFSAEWSRGWPWTRNKERLLKILSWFTDNCDGHLKRDGTSGVFQTRKTSWSIVAGGNTSLTSNFSLLSFLKKKKPRLCYRCSVCVCPSLNFSTNWQIFTKFGVNARAMRLEASPTSYFVISYNP